MLENILLIEPNYKCKYPPLGLMKISYYYKEIRGANVWFCKGKLPEKISDKVIEKIKNDKYYINQYGDKIDEHINEINKIIKENSWDRINVCTLFTYEYEKTVEAIEYAKSLVGKDKVYTGGILATLMKDELAKDTDVTVIPNQLYSAKLLGYDDDTNIDKLTPDYSMLSNTEYKYENDDAYYAYTTRGCGMNCGFCAVKTLEPQFEPFISIKDQILEINEKYGEKKDLLLMDNNVLKSKYFSKIIDEIIELGFEKGATYINPKTGKKKRRFVDFNQGLDANLINEKKAKLLSKIAIKPARIAFDHIEDEQKYINAIKTVANDGVNYLSNYLLYNSEVFEGKGNKYNADTPQDLYKRLEINVKLQDELNKNKPKEAEKIQIFSFPMRYIPLNSKKRGYVGTKWNKKYLRAIQSILIPTQGKGVGNKEFFYVAFGKNEEEYMEILLMPEAYITSRGEPSKAKKVNRDNLKIKFEKYNMYNRLRNEWKSIYRSMDEKEKNNFIDIISDNKFDYEHYNKIEFKKGKKLFIHYMTIPSLLVMMNELLKNECNEEIKFINNYIKNNCNDIYKNVCVYIEKSSQYNNKVLMYKKVYGENSYLDLMKLWIEKKCETKNFKSMIHKFYKIDENYLNIIEMIIKSGILEKEDLEKFTRVLSTNIINDNLSYLFNTASYVYEKMPLEEKNKFKDINLDLQISIF